MGGHCSVNTYLSMANPSGIFLHKTQLSVVKIARVVCMPVVQI